MNSLVVGVMVYCYELKMCESYQLRCEQVHIWKLLMFII